MCFSPIKSFNNHIAETIDDKKKIKAMMARNDFYYFDNIKLGWSGMDNESVIWVLHYDFNTLIGFSCYKHDKTSPTKYNGGKARDYMWLLYLLIDKEYQSCGYGTKIINEYKTLARLKKQWVLILDLDKGKDNYYKLIDFYTKLGFEMDNGGKPDGYGQIIMRCRLTD